MNKIANRDVRLCVAKRVPFQGSNLFAETKVINDCEVYTVYSYGYHFPLYIAITEPTTHTITWYRNSDRYSMTTAKHFGQCNPYTVTIPMDTQKMIAIANRGVAGLLEIA